MFCIVLTYSYLCPRNEQKLVSYQRVSIVKRRYVAGIRNLFRLFMNEVDYWVIYDNSEFPAVLVATGGKDDRLNIMSESKYKAIADYVK